MGENIIGTPKMRNDFWGLKFSPLLPIKLLIFNYAEAKGIAINLFTLFLYWVCRFFHGFSSVLLLILVIALTTNSKALIVAKVTENRFAIAIVERAIKKRSKELIPKKKQRRLRLKTLQKALRKGQLDSIIIISVFGGTNNIFANYNSRDKKHFAALYRIID